MMNRKKVVLFATLGIITLAPVTLLGVYFLPHRVHSHVVFDQAAVSQTLENIEEQAVPLAAPTGMAVEDVTSAGKTETVRLAAKLQPVTADEQPAPLEPATEQPAPEDPVPEQPAPEEPAPEDPTPEEPEAEEPEAEEPEAEEPEAEEPEAEEPETPARAVKPDDITNVEAMAEYLYKAGVEFWATEKNFSGTTTRPVSTRVAATIGAGTAVDCPGGDTVRVDAAGNEYDSYAIADHFREYVDMPDLKYFKLYLSDKDYTVSRYGVREDVVGAFYQYGSGRATYTPAE